METRFQQNGNARAEVVNRTHRIVREQALTMRAQQARSRSLWVPIGICSTLLIVVCYAIWAMMDGYDLTPNGIPDASDQLPVLLLWFLPVTALALGFIWLRHVQAGNEASR